MNNKTCDTCGRPMTYCNGDCSKCKDVFFTEYCGKAAGCLRETKPECPLRAVIPIVTVESIEGISVLADCFVHVSDINTTFYIDDKHRSAVTWAGPVEAKNYDFENNPLNLRGQTVYDFQNNRAIVYSKTGEYRLIELKTN